MTKLKLLLGATGLGVTLVLLVLMAASATGGPRSQSAHARGSCAVTNFYGDYPFGGEPHDAVIHTDTGSCDERVVVRCQGGNIVIDYHKPGPDKLGMHPQAADEPCAQVRLIYVATFGGGDRIDMTRVTKSNGFTSLGASTAPGNEPIELRPAGGSDAVLGSPFDDLELGLGGNDVLKGFRGPDQLDGGKGGDLLKGGPGADALTGGPGNDTVIQG